MKVGRPATELKVTMADRAQLESIARSQSLPASPSRRAALDIANGSLLTQCKAQHRHQAFLRFLRHIEANVPKDLERSVAARSTRCQI
jgi:hypothetical protein